MFTISQDERVLRHIPGGTTFQAPGPRITSANFKLRPDEFGLSISLQSITSGRQLLMRIGNPITGSQIAVAIVDDIRQLGLEVIPDPIPDDQGHALIVSGRESLSSQATRKRLSLIFQFLPK